MENNDVVLINSKQYEYNGFYGRLKLLDTEEESKEEIACPKCLGTEFSISYGNYECIANCKCGHSMTVYDG